MLEWLLSTKIDLKHPYLQIHHKIANSFRTLSPYGSWSMILNLPEYFNALKDYNLHINKGYFFKSENIFSQFVDDLYSLRRLYSKGDPINFTCKLIMNSLFGRFAMKPILSTQKFINKEDLNKITEKYQLEDFIDLEESGYFITFFRSF